MKNKIEMSAVQRLNGKTFETSVGTASVLTTDSFCIADHEFNIHITVSGRPIFEDRYNLHHEGYPEMKRDFEAAKQTEIGDMVIEFLKAEEALAERVAHLTAPGWTVVVFEDGTLEQVTGQTRTQRPVRLFVDGERTEEEVVAALESGQQWLADSTY